jgi:hypothetical protein
MSNQLSKKSPKRPDQEAAAAPQQTPQKSPGGRPSGPPRGMAERIVFLPIGQLRPFPNNPRRHPQSQIASLMKSIKRVWTNPILIDETGTVLAGHGRLEAANRLGMTERFPR